MLQVYDRVLASRSLPTLVALFGLVVGLYLFFGIFDLLRKRVLSRIGYSVDSNLSMLAQESWIESSTRSNQSSSSRPLNDLTRLRKFMSSGGLPALFDLPWLPVFLAIVYILHVWLGILATAGAVLVVTIALINELSTKKPSAMAQEFETRESNFAEQIKRTSPAIYAMGMTQNIGVQWDELRQNAMMSAQSAGNRSETFGSISKAIRMILQSGILALGAYLAILQQITPGAMIAASILAARALTPVDQAISNWGNFLSARQTYRRLKTVLAGVSEAPDNKLNLPKPKGKLKVKNLSKRNLQDKNAAPILSQINFKLAPGDGLGVIGPSASGKSSLAKLLMGIWDADKGHIRLDGATLDQWDRQILGKHVGYLPQHLELLPGTIHQNIARFDPEVTDEEVIEAAELAGVHDLILHLPEGYGTFVGEGNTVLSGGQVQCIALARAVLRKPALIVLDEPNSNLDQQGDVALSAAIQKLREHGSTVIVMAHRPSAIESVNMVLMLRDGQQVDFGTKEKVLNKVTKISPPATKKVPVKRTVNVPVKPRIIAS